MFFCLRSDNFNLKTQWELFLFYLLKSGCCLVIFYIFFKLLMSRSTFFHFNRITLLVGLLGCTSLPFVELTTTEESFLHIPCILFMKRCKIRTISQKIRNRQNLIFPCRRSIRKQNHPIGSLLFWVLSME